jgi:hypothetical protein
LEAVALTASTKFKRHTLLMAEEVLAVRISTAKKRDLMITELKIKVLTTVSSQKLAVYLKRGLSRPRIFNTRSLTVGMIMLLLLLTATMGFKTYLETTLLERIR